MTTLTARPVPARTARIAGAAWIVLAYLVAAAGVWLGLWGGDAMMISGGMWEAPSVQHWLGTNRLGQDVLSRTLAGAATAFEVGLSVALGATAFGAVAGGIAGYFSQTWIDEIIQWCKGTLDAIPFYLFVAAVAFALQGHAAAMHLAMIATFWTTTARLVRAETQHIRQLDFIAAARVSGLKPWRVILRHILPNSAHIILVQATLTFVAAIKTEVILSFLGIGLHDTVSWGLMIAEAGQDILAGQYMNFIAASLALFGLIMAFNRLADDLQAALDPRTRMLALSRLV